MLRNIRIRRTRGKSKGTWENWLVSLFLGYIFHVWIRPYENHKAKVSGCADQYTLRASNWRICTNGKIRLYFFFHSVLQFQRKSWFLTDIIRLINTGRIVNKTEVEKLQQDVVPSISVLDRLIGKFIICILKNYWLLIFSRNFIE